MNLSFGNKQGLSSAVASGSIDPTPEPATFVLLGMALLAGLWIERRRLFAQS